MHKIEEVQKRSGNEKVPARIGSRRSRTIRIAKRFHLKCGGARRRRGSGAVSKGRDSFTGAPLAAEPPGAEDTAAMIGRAEGPTFGLFELAR
jgi:hypothetical protein